MFDLLLLRLTKHGQTKHESNEWEDAANEHFVLLPGAERVAAPIPQLLWRASYSATFIIRFSGLKRCVLLREKIPVVAVSDSDTSASKEIRSCAGGSSPYANNALSAAASSIQ
jgi:hypothetical protein